MLRHSGHCSMRRNTPYCQTCTWRTYTRLDTADRGWLLSAARPATSCTSWCHWTWCLKPSHLRRPEKGRPKRVERWVAAKYGLGAVAGRSAARRIRLEHPLRIVEWHHQVSAPLSYIPDLDCRISGKLMLDSRVVFIRDCRLHVGIPNRGGRPERSKHKPGQRKRRPKQNPQFRRSYRSEAAGCRYRWR